LPGSPDADFFAAAVSHDHDYGEAAPDEGILLVEKSSFRIGMVWRFTSFRKRRKLTSMCNEIE
jgi:hypothetical protein